MLVVTPLPTPQQQCFLSVKELIEETRRQLRNAGASEWNPGDAPIFRLLNQAERRANEALSRLAAGLTVPDAECQEIADIASAAHSLYFLGTTP